MGKWATYRHRGRFAPIGFILPPPPVSEFSESDEGGGLMFVYCTTTPNPAFFFQARASLSESGPWSSSILTLIGDPGQISGLGSGSYFVQISLWNAELQQISDWSASEVFVMA